ncbi:MAG TPA: 3-phosphoshikimate 1-carboxyvinyltransferase [Candidatus Polarisedimenticolaceae bacterium]|nr:3-phosphoshikimate 1-carboxyvinyltransferase [Candidatus Polarisedimenticolaceae bacterium]
MPPRCIDTARAPLNGAFAAPPSKSATHRAVIAAAVARGVSRIERPLDAEDTRRTVAGLRALGVRVEATDGSWTVEGAAGTIRGGGSLDLGESGTSARLLLALAATAELPSVLDGAPRLRERPMAELITSLRALGARIEPDSATGLPVRTGGGRVRGGAVSVPGARSSQFTSALLLSASMFDRGVTLAVTEPRVSQSYARMTVETLERFGAVVAHDGAGMFEVRPAELRATALTVEGDYSSASYAMAAAAIIGGRVCVRGLRSGSLQPDARFPRDLASLGCSVVLDGDQVTVSGTGPIPSFSWDLADAPDLAPTAAILALFAEGRCTISGLAHLRLKESDRPAVLADNLARLGAAASMDGGTLTIDPPARGALRGALVSSAGDHRIAMAFAIAGLAIPGVAIDRGDVVAKSYPGFWDDLAGLVRTGSSGPG